MIHYAVTDEPILKCHANNILKFEPISIKRATGAPPP